MKVSTIFARPRPSPGIFLGDTILAHRGKVLKLELILLLALNKGAPSAFQNAGNLITNRRNVNRTLCI